MRTGTLTAQAVKLAKKKKGITRVDFEKIGFAPNSFSRTISSYFVAKGTKRINGKQYTNYVVA